MFLHIVDSMTVEEVQDRFNECFPFLTIEFYSVPHKPFQATDNRYRYDAKELIGEIRTNHAKGAMEIKSWYTVARVEKELWERYGLHAQVCRLNPSGEAVQTASSDNFTLFEQSQMVLEAERLAV
ncbi:hypothetical protein HRG84_11145 [Flavisolibacter sp. BT320]|nr:hypothetical protein [Flavisolibacter longurius]